MTRAKHHPGWGGHDRADEHIRPPRGTLASPGVVGLAIAMLEATHLDLMSDCHLQDRASAEAWVASDAHDACSFAWCCDVTGLDAAASRDRLWRGAPVRTPRRAHLRRRVS